MHRIPYLRQYIKAGRMLGIFYPKWQEDLFGPPEFFFKRFKPVLALLTNPAWFINLTYKKN